MLRFRMKMLSKENLMAKTSDIGSCLRLLTGKLLIVGFVMASVYGSSGAGEISHKDILFSDKSELQLKRLAAQAMNANAVLEKSAELLQQQLALQEQETKLLQEQLAAQPAPKTPVRIKKRRDTLTDAVTNLTSGVFATPLRGMDTSGIVSALETAELTGDDVRDYPMLCDLFEIHIKRRTPTPNSVTALAITDGGPAVGASMALVKMGPEEKPCDEPTDLNDMFSLFKRRLAGVMGPDFMRFYTKEFDVLVVARKASSPMKHAMPAAPVLDLQKEGERYVKKIMSAIKSRETLFNLVQEYRPSDEEGSEMHAMLHLMLGTNISDAATAFKPTQDATTLIEVGDQLRDKFFNTAQLTFFHYMSGQTNKTNVREIVAITNGGRGKAFPDCVLTDLNEQLSEIFYPRRETGTLTFTKYEITREHRMTAQRSQGLLTLGGWGFPVLNYLAERALCPFGSASHHLLEDDTSSPAPQIGASKQITDGEANAEEM